MRVLVAEDHPMFRDGLVALISTDPRFEVVAAVDGADGVIAYLSGPDSEADVAVLDLAMPGGGGNAAARWIKDHSPATRILVLTSHDGEGEILAALDAGASSYLVKTATPEQILAALAATAVGSAALSGEALDALSRRRGRDGSGPHFPELTARELDVLAAMSDGLDNTEISRRLGLSDKTVRNYVSSVLTKLQVSHRAAAVVEGRRRGLGDRHDVD